MAHCNTGKINEDYQKLFDVFFSQLHQHIFFQINPATELHGNIPDPTTRSSWKSKFSVSLKWMLRPTEVDWELITRGIACHDFVAFCDHVYENVPYTAHDLQCISKEMKYGKPISSGIPVERKWNAS